MINGLAQAWLAVNISRVDPASSGNPDPVTTSIKFCLSGCAPDKNELTWNVTSKQISAITNLCPVGVYVVDDITDTLDWCINHKQLMCIRHKKCFKLKRTHCLPIWYGRRRDRINMILSQHLNPAIQSGWLWYSLNLPIITLRRSKACSFKQVWFAWYYQSAWCISRNIIMYLSSIFNTIIIQ